jgi:N-acetylneuraminic acid mutarotase
MFGGMDANGNALSQTWLYDGKAWIPSTAQGPSARFEHAMATLGNEVVLFGGTDGLHTVGDTWIFDGERWTQGPSSGPPARNSHAMATLGKQIVLFGGNDANNVSLSDTWLFDGKTWKQSTAKGPPARFWHAMTTANSSVVLFGGTGTNGDLGDTWLFDGSGWSKVLPSKSPSARSVPAMASIKGTAYLFGGYAGLNAGFQEFADTWRFDGVSWTQVSGKTAPSARAASGMAYQNGGIVLFGGSAGEDDSVTYVQDTWRFDGSKWTTEPASGPPASDSQGMATQ